jgi:hypothetical protein
MSLSLVKDGASFSPMALRPRASSGSVKCANWNGPAGPQVLTFTKYSMSALIFEVCPRVDLAVHVVGG